MEYKTIRVKTTGKICYIQLYRPDNNNTINDTMIEECHTVLDSMPDDITILVLEGLPETFCFGADFNEIYQKNKLDRNEEPHPEILYQLWLKLYTGPFISIANVKGKVNAGGMGFVSACDIVIADSSVKFSLSELLFGIYPAIVFPFLVNKIGLNKANYITMMTEPISAEKAYEYGLINAYAQETSGIVRKHLLRLKVLSKQGILNYKQYRNNYSQSLFHYANIANEANKKMFSDKSNLAGIFSYIETGEFPWEQKRGE